LKPSRGLMIACHAIDSGELAQGTAWRPIAGVKLEFRVVPAKVNYP